MFRTSQMLLFGALCTGGVVACGTSDAPPKIDRSGVTLQLNRLENGDLQYCEENGECLELPYDGDCATMEITIDTATGQTCERCVLADGTVAKETCNGTSVACAVVTIPDPDCVVCAYVDGAIIYSSCIADEPQCYSDADCRDPAGLYGRCIEGECVYEPQPECYDDADCPPGLFLRSS